MTTSYHITDSIRISWELFKKNWNFWLIAWLIFMLFCIGIMGVGHMVNAQHNLVLGAMNLIGLLLRMWLHLGLIGAAITTLKAQEPSTPQLFAYGYLLPRMLFASILYSLPLLILCALFIVLLKFLSLPTLVLFFLGLLLGGAGLLISIRWCFYSFLLVELNCTSLESLQLSWQASRKHFWFLCAFFLLIGFINLLGLLAAGLGLFVTVPLTLIATTHVYMKMETHPEA